jgi:hypothetical protein
MLSLTLPFPRDDTEDTNVLAHPALIYRIEELERNLVGAACHGFDNVVDQLKVVNPGVEFRMDGFQFLKYVENWKTVLPRMMVGMFEMPGPIRLCNLLTIFVS